MVKKQKVSTLTPEDEADLAVVAAELSEIENETKGKLAPLCRVAVYKADGHLLFHSEPLPKKDAEQLAEGLRKDPEASAVMVRDVR